MYGTTEILTGDCSKAEPALLFANLHTEAT